MTKQIKPTTFTDHSGYAAPFTGYIQIDRSGRGHCWRNVDVRDLREDVLVALADEDGAIVDGATAFVGGMSYRASAADVQPQFRLTDGNAIETLDSLDEAVETAAEWYDFLEMADMPTLDTIGIESVDDLNSAIVDWEQKIAEACGHKDFFGHGNYAVSAASEMGLRLRAEEVSE